MAAYKNKLQLYIQYFFIVFFIFLLFPAFFYKLPEEGIDPSWNIAIHLAHKYQLIFGKDFVFTYGPLGILSSRLPITINLFVYLLFDLYFLITLFFILKASMKNHFGYGLVLFIFLSFIIGMYEGLDQWYFVFFLFYLFSFLREPKSIAYIIQAALLSIICFYFKVGLGITAIVIFLITISYAALRKKISLIRLGAILFLYVLVIWIISLLLHVNLEGYIVNSLHLIDAYNDAMFRPLGNIYMVFIYMALLIISVIAFWIIYRIVVSISRKQIVQNLDELFIYGIVALSAFVVFKSGFVRADTHIYQFFKSIGLIVTFLYLHAPEKSGKRIAAICCWVVLAISSWSVNFIPGSYQPYSRLVNLSFFSIKVGEIKNYFDGLKKYNSELRASDNLTSAKNELKNVIGDHTVDIIPAEISKIYFNGLRYNPRPVIQSYSAYDGYLDSLNYQKYMAPDAPDYILFALNSIDNRYPFFDETKTKLAILSHYTIIGDVKGDLLLKKKPIYENLVKTNEEIINLKFGDVVTIKKVTPLQYSKILIKYNLWGKIKRLFYHPPLLKITVTLDNGDTESFRGIKPILAGGVILNKYVDSEKEFQLLMQSDGRLNANIKKIRFESDSDEGGFASDIKIVTSYYAFAKKQTEEYTSDSLSIEKLLMEDDRYKPRLVSPPSYVEKTLRYGINSFKAHSHFIRVEGWAFLEKTNNKQMLVKALLRSGDKFYELPSENKLRKDLPVYFGRQDIEKSGFTSLISKSHLPPGDYQLGIAVIDPENQKSWVNFTDYHTQIRSDKYKLEKITSIDLASVSRNNIQYGIDFIEEDEEKIIVKGWAFVNNTDSKKTATNLILKNRESIYRISTDITQRIDVIAHFKDSLLGYSGFYVCIPKGKLPNGLYNIGIEKIYLDRKEQSLRYTDEKLRLGIPEIFAPASISELPATAEFLSGIDFVKDDKEVVSISGWALKNIDRIQNTTIKIILKSDNAQFVSETELKSRPDITSALKSKFNLEDCGFSAKISKRNLPKGRYQIAILISEEDQNQAVKFIDQFVIKD